ncbi:hypothetical protein LSH36_2662g00003, partial [Paralvinella palmiformis]
MADVAVGIIWMSVNDVLVPVIRRKCSNIYGDLHLVPLLVVQYIIGSLEDVPVSRVLCTPEEIPVLTKCCRERGFTMTFDEYTELISFDSLLELTSERIVFRVLPNRKPVDSESMSCDETMEISKNKSFGDGMLSFSGNALKPNLAGDVPQEDKNMEEETISLETKYRRRLKLPGLEEDVQIFRGNETDKHGTSTTNRRNYSIIKKAMFGEEVHCLLKDGNYYILLEELRVLFFSHLSFFKLKQISQRLVSSTGLIPVHELKNLSPYLGIIRHGDIIRVEEVKLFLVNTKALLQKRENRKESTNKITDHKGFLGLKLRKLRHHHKEQEHILSSGNNVNNMLILNYSNLPVSYFT